MYIPAQAAIALGAATTATNIGWDLKGDDGNSDLPTGARVAYLRVDGVSDTEFNEIDGIIEQLYLTFGTNEGDADINSCAACMSAVHGGHALPGRAGGGAPTPTLPKVVSQLGRHLLLFPAAFRHKVLPPAPRTPQDTDREPR